MGSYINENEIVMKWFSFIEIRSDISLKLKANNEVSE